MNRRAAKRQGRGKTGILERGGKIRTTFGAVAHSNDTALLNTGYCGGYIDGVTDVEAMWKAVDKKAGINAHDHYCMPEEVTNGQVLKILKKWLDNNPEKLHWRADSIIHAALLEAFPCK